MAALSDQNNRTELGLYQAVSGENVDVILEIPPLGLQCTLSTIHSFTRTVFPK